MRYIDLHCDTLGRITPRPGSDTPQDLRSNSSCQVDAERLHASGCAAQFFAMFMSIQHEKDTLRRCLEMTDVFRGELEKCSDILAFAGNADDLDRNLAAGKTSAFLTIEDSGIIYGDIALLRVLYRLGVRLITLTWNYDHAVGSPNISPESTAKGLTENGIEFVRECNRLGVLVDVSHLSDAGFWDVVKYSEKPFVASHSDARAVASHTRNLTDDMIRALAEKGGVSGLNYCGGFVRPRGGDMYAPFESEKCTLDDLAAHAAHMAKVGGVGCVALGSDFDGIGSWPDGLDAADKVPLVADALKRAGFSESDVDAIMFSNALRVIREAMK